MWCGGGSDGSDGSELVGAIVAGAGLTAGAFIVTLFGDVVEPRGGRVATGSIIEACERVGLNATLIVIDKDRPWDRARLARSLRPRRAARADGTSAVPGAAGRGRPAALCARRKPLSPHG